MKPTRLVLGLGVAVGLVAGGVETRILRAEQTSVTRTPLATMDVAGIERAEATMLRVEIAPGAAVGKHYHPGPELVYVLDGAGILEVEGNAPLNVKAGEHFERAPNERHDFRNASRTEPVRVLVFLVAEKGQPVATHVDTPVAEQSPEAGMSGAAPQPGSPATSGAASSGAEPSASPR